MKKGDWNTLGVLTVVQMAAHCIPCIWGRPVGEALLFGITGSILTVCILIPIYIYLNRRMDGTSK